MLLVESEDKAVVEGEMVPELELIEGEFEPGDEGMAQLAASLVQMYPDGQ